MIFYYPVVVEFHALLLASVNMKRFTLLLGGDGVEVQAYLGFHWSQPGWKGQGHLLTAPYMASTVNTAGRDMEVASLLLDSGETSHFPPGYFWYQPSRRGLNILLPLMRVKVQVAHMFSIDVMLMSVWEGHIFTQWVWKAWVPIQPFLTLNSMGSWTPCYHQAGVKSLVSSTELVLRGWW